MTTVEHATGVRELSRDDDTALQAVSVELHEQRLFRVQQLMALDARATGGSSAPDDGTPLGVVAQSLGAAARFALADIDAALERLQDGRFGRCDRCRSTIPFGVLRAVPTIRTCLPCQRGAVLDRARPEADTAAGRRRDRGLTDGRRTGRRASEVAADVGGGKR